MRKNLLRQIFLLSSAVFTTFIILPAFAGTFYVRLDGNDSNSGLTNTYQGAWATIQKAADTLRPGDTVEIQAGIYNEAIQILISGESTQPITYRASGEVIIDAQSTRQYCVKLEAVNFIKIEGFTLRNSTQTGILLDKANHNIITKNTSHNNLSQGIRLDNYSTYNILSSNTLYNNTGGSGALGNRSCGIYLYNSSNNNTIDNNIAYQNGTGIWLEGSSSNCTITDNKTYSNGWGGLILAGGTVNNTVSYNLSYSNSSFGLEVCYSANNNLVRNNTIYSNQRNGIQLNNTAVGNIIKNNIIAYNGTSSSGYCGIYIEAGSSATISYNDIFNNGYGGNNRYGGVATGSNDIYSNPLFKSTTSSSPDFLKLSSIAKGDSQDSPCIDAGDPADVASSASGQRIDIGVYDLYTLRSQATYYVKSDGNNLNDGRTLATAWVTIQKAADTVNPLDIVEVQAGTYNEQVTIARSGLANQYITFRANGQVIIDGQNTRPYCIKLDGADYIKIDGFTVRNATDNGILLDNTATYNIISNNTCHNNGASGIRLNNTSKYNTLFNNTCYSNGAGQSAYGDRSCGIYLFNSSNYNTLDSNICRNNTSTGIWLEGSSSYCTIKNNKTYSNGYIGIIAVGGTNYNAISNNLIYLNSSSGMHIGYSAQYNTVKNNTLYKNTNHGIVFDNSSPNNTIKNNIITQNGLSSNNLYGVYISDAASSANNFYYNNIYQNGLDGARSCGGFATQGTGDISLEPLFKSTTSTDPDFLKLKSLMNGDTVESPCIDSGSPSDTPSVPSGKRTDIGAFDQYSHNPVEGGLPAEYYDNMDFTSLKLVRMDPRINFDWGNYTPDASIAAGTFSVRWQGQVKIDYAQTYTFYVTTDDGCRLWIDNRLIIDKWSDHSGPTEYSAAISLTPGFHDIKYEFYTNTGWAVAKLYWSSPSISKSPVPYDHLYSFARLDQNNFIQGGLKAKYYNSFNIDNPNSPVIVRVDPQINFDWGYNMPDAALDWDRYSAKLKGKIRIDTADTYNFYTITDDGVRLWVNNRLLVDSWWNQGTTEKQGNIYLTPGLYDIELNYYENGGGAVCKLLYSSSTISKQVIPSTKLYYENERYIIDGLYAEYFDNKDFTNCKIKRLDSKIDYDWQYGSPDPLIQPDAFSIRWAGQVKADYNENYTFYVNSDDGVKLWIDNLPVIDSWIDKWSYETSGTVYLTQGWHDIKIEYYENGVQSVAKLAYSSPSTPKTIVPEDHLRSSQPKNISTSSFICHLESIDDIQNPTTGHAGTIVETGTGKLNFVQGINGNGVELDGTNVNREGFRLSVYDLNKKEGTIAFWFKPNWNSDDNKTHYFFTNNWDWNGCIQAFKYSNNAIYWKIVRDGVQHVIVSDTARRWNAGEWHHLAFSYGFYGMKFYLDGNPIPISWTFHGEIPYKGTMPDNFSSELYFGESSGGYESIDAVVDELVISKIQEAPHIITPSVSIVLPSNNEGFTSQPITVTGTVSEDNVTVVIARSPSAGGGDEAIYQAAFYNGTFTAEGLSLVLGRNTITAKAVDKWGNNDQDSITVFYDTTPPDTFTVYDDGDYTNSITQLHAIWDPASDPESGIKEYQYAIGTTQGGTDVVLWMSVGLDTEVTKSGLNLIEGQKYFFSVKAINRVRMETVCYSDGIIPDITAPTFSITSHSDGDLLSSQPITVRGTIDDNNAKVMVNLNEAVVSNGAFVAEGVPLQTGPNDIVVTATDVVANSSSKSIRVIFDNTFPTLPLVTDDGNFTNQLTKLHARWSSSDLETGIKEYRYSIGTSPGATDVLGWTLAGPSGLDTEATVEGLSLVVGQKYHFNVTAKNGLGNESVNSSDGITAKANDPPVITGIQPQPLSGHVGETLNFIAEAQDIDRDNLEYQFSVDGGIIQTWQSSNSCLWPTDGKIIGEHSLKVEVDDSMGGVISRTEPIWLFRTPPPPPN